MIDRRMYRFVVSVRLRKGSAPKVREILREGPPFDLERTSLERHLVFLAADELVFLFEGTRADEQAERLLQDPSVLGRAGRIGMHVSGRPRVPEEVFGWERRAPLAGLSYGPQPGPGNSEGGPAE
jgi:hypothetical protein